MAESILRLTVNSAEYDNKLKRAAEGLTRYADECRKVGGTLEVVEKETLDYVRAIGQMDTTSRTATGKLAEMKKTFTELSVVYKNMTDQEKASPFGKALATSLDELKGRIGESKVQLDDINKSINGGGGLSGALDAVAGKFGLSIDQITKFGGVVGAATTALKVAKDAFFQSESNVDEWGRTVASAESVYQGFLQSLNNGDFSGFIGHINEIIKKSQEAYNALDELNTRMTIINPERTRLQARSTELKAIIRREGANSEKGQAAQSELRQLEGMLTQAFKTESQLNMNAFKAQVDKKLQEAGIKLGKRDYDFLMRTFSSDASYMAMRRGAKGSVQMNYEAGGSYDEGSVSKVDTRNINQRLLDIFTDEWRKEYAPLLNAAFSARGGAASTMLSDARYLNGGGSGGGGRSGRSSSSKGFDISSIAFDPNKAMLAAVKGTGEDGPSEVWKAITEGAKEASSEVDNLTAAFEKLNEAQGVTVKDANKESKNMSDSWRTASAAIGAVGNAMSGLKNPAIDIMTVIGQSIATIALAYAQNLAKDKTTSGNIWAFIAAAAAATISMATTIASIHSSTGYAQGGIVKGNSYSGDNIYGGPDAMVNAGELVLTKAQQSTLASQLQEGGMRNINLSGRIRGTDIILSVDRTLSLEGKQLLTWGR